MDSMYSKRKEGKLHQSRRQPLWNRYNKIKRSKHLALKLALNLRQTKWKWNGLHSRNQCVGCSVPFRTNSRQKNTILSNGSLHSRFHIYLLNFWIVSNKYKRGEKCGGRGKIV